jgi:hypothetical protein
MIKEQLSLIITCIDELERGFIKSEKIQMYLMKQDNIVLDVEVAKRSILLKPYPK